MLKRCILAENRKLHASPIWAMFFVLPILSATYGTFNYLQNLEILTDGWYSLWTQHTLFYSMLFFPAMVATYAAYLWRLEHLGHNWNLIMASPVPPLALFAAKFAVVTKLALLTHGFVFALFVYSRTHEVHHTYSRNLHRILEAKENTFMTTILRTQFQQILTIKSNRTFCHFKRRIPYKDRRKCTLTGTVRSHNCMYLARFHRQVNTFQYLFAINAGMQVFYL